MFVNSSSSPARMFILGFLSCFSIGVLVLLFAFFKNSHPRVLGAVSQIPGSVCQSVQLYHAPSWQPLTLLDLENIQEHESLYFVAVPTDTSGIYDRARFRVRSSLLLTDWQETEDKNSSGNFYIQYTIPLGIDHLTVEAELRNTQGKWQ